MKKQNDIIEELKMLGSPLAIMSRSMPYVVPQDYFENLAPEMLAHVAEVISDEPAIDKLEKGMPYAVPAGYFESLPEQILAQVVQEKKTKVISIKWWQTIRWAAAVLVLGVGFGSYMMFNHPTSPEKLLANTPKSTISDYVEQNIDEFDTELILKNAEHVAIQPSAKQLDDKEIVQYLNETDGEERSELN